MRSGYFIKVAVFSFFLSVFFSCQALAYLDAGTGSYIIQMLIAIFLGGIFAVKIFWKKITNFFKNLFSKDVKR